jgi:hypothetical protein
MLAVVIVCVTYELVEEGGKVGSSGVWEPCGGNNKKHWKV